MGDSVDRRAGKGRGAGPARRVAPGAGSGRECAAGGHGNASRPPLCRGAWLRPCSRSRRTPSRRPSPARPRGVAGAGRSEVRARRLERALETAPSCKFGSEICSARCWTGDWGSAFSAPGASRRRGWTCFAASGGPAASSPAGGDGKSWGGRPLEAVLEAAVSCPCRLAARMRKSPART